MLSIFFIKIILRKDYKKKLFKNTSLPNKLDILGNGPSLKETLIKNNFNGENTLVVNHFADSSYYEEIKPKFYVIQDRYFWESNVLGKYLNKRNITFKNINEKTSWPILIFVPNRISNQQIKSLFKNKLISVKRINLINLPKIFNINFGLNFPNLFYKFWDNNIFSPPVQNVISASIYISILMDIKEIILHGVDMSFFKALEVNQKNNKLGIYEDHFYGKEFSLQYKDKYGKKLSSMEYELKKWGDVFLNMSVLEEYSRYKNINIINKSLKSYIDAFKRV